jgi:hypothetical protein
MAPPPGQERDVTLARAALASPPDKTSFEALTPSPTERTTFENILRLRKEEPDSPLLEELQRKLDELEAVRVTFMGDKFITVTPKGTDITPYRVEEDLGDRVVLLQDGTGPVEERRSVASFDGHDRIVLTIGPTRVPMTRVAKGTAPKPNEVPSTPIARGGADTPTRTTDTSSNPSSHDAGASSADYDACVKEYYRCIGRMNADDRAALGGTIEATKKIFADAKGDPEEMRRTLDTCKQAVSLAHATFCQ